MKSTQQQKTIKIIAKKVEGVWKILQFVFWGRDQNVKNVPKRENYNNKKHILHAKTRNVLLQKRKFGRHLRDHYDDDQKEGGRSGQSAGGLRPTIGKFIENCSM